MPYIHRSLAIMPTTFHLLFYAILDAKKISKVAAACNDTTEYCCLDKTNSTSRNQSSHIEVYGVCLDHSFGLKDC